MSTVSDPPTPPPPPSVQEKHKGIRMPEMADSRIVGKLHVKDSKLPFLASVQPVFDWKHFGVTGLLSGAFRPSASS